MIGASPPRLVRSGMLTPGAMSAAILSHMAWLGYSVQGDHGLVFGTVLATFACGVTMMMMRRLHPPGYMPSSPN
jgi:hypothetical protein